MSIGEAFVNPEIKIKFTFKGGIADGDVILLSTDTYWVEYPDPNQEGLIHAYARKKGSTLLLFKETTTKRLMDQTKPKDRK